MTGQDLKNSILQLAIQGKLVPQDANDEPASVLLERIKFEKQKLIKEKKIKKEKPLPEITEEEKPFEIPESWEWVRLGEIFSMQAGKNSKADEIIIICNSNSTTRVSCKQYNRNSHPPLSEQHRIVSKIEDLFAQIEPLAKALSTPM